MQLQSEIQKSGEITLDQLKEIAVNLSGQAWCNYCPKVGYTKDGQSIMAIQCRNIKGKPIEVNFLLHDGFIQTENFIYYIRRIHENGEPYRK